MRFAPSKRLRPEYRLSTGPTRIPNRPPSRCADYSRRTSRQSSRCDCPAHFSAASTGSPLAIDAFTSFARRIEIRSLAVERLRPWQANGAMAGNHAHGWDARERGEIDEPALQGTVDDRQVLHETRDRLQTASGWPYRGRSGRNPCAPAARPASRESFRRDRAPCDRRRSRLAGTSLHLVDELVANDPAKRLEIEFAAHRQGSRQIVVPDEGRPEPVEGRVAEHMIRVLMRIDDIEDGLVGVRADGGEQALRRSGRCRRCRSRPRPCRRSRSRYWRCRPNSLRS